MKKKRFFQKDFVDNSYTRVIKSAADKARFCSTFTRFIERGFTPSVLREADVDDITHFLAVWPVSTVEKLVKYYFADPVQQLESIKKIREANSSVLTEGKYGMADVGRALVAYIDETNLIVELEVKAALWVESNEREELARLTEKYGVPA